MFSRTLSFIYGVICYAITMATFVVLMGFLANVGLPRSLDSASYSAVMHALAVDLGLLLLFSLQHSVMARPGFKRAWTRIVSPAIERSTYMLFSCAAMLFMFWKWEPIGGVIWNINASVGRYGMYGLYVFGWMIVLSATFLINHFDLFGLRQVWLNLRKRKYTQLVFRTPGFYRMVRHPLYVGWILVFWSAPTMTAAHLVFALATTIYILIAIKYEERDLMEVHPEYSAYRRQVPMLIPGCASAAPTTQQLKRERISA